MGLIQKHDIKQYWSMDEMLATPFVRKLMSRDEYHNIQTFLHLCDNETYPKKTDPEYDPRKKLAFYLRHCVNLSGKFGVLVNIYPLKKAQFPSKDELPSNVIIPANRISTI